ncbi:hypothetical protein ACIPY2_06505 [Paenarthrobacter sp. NPDC089675]|uniref:hypothetical protein n=1 Tax=Paenarthrobacter sp. NPDC089675 TaxID=3364376 RepID=UPI0037F1D764
MDKDVDFAFLADDAVIEEVDAGYRAKYRNSPYLQPIFGIGPHAAAVRLVPRVEDRREERREDPLGRHRH